jgi:acetyltransferase-like isoleucine patch superfamily enzyme
LLLTGDKARITIGPRCYVNRQTMFDASGEITVGAETMIGPFCYFTDHDHGVRAGLRPSEGELVTRPTRIGARCWIGAHVTVLKGVTIGDGSVVGAGSVVTKSLPVGVIAVGNPARVVKQVPA